MVPINLYIATHKQYTMPHSDMYKPVLAGAALSNQDLPYLKDSDGFNISSKNKNWCELTVLYWMWKNTDSDYLGLCHYRRYFMVNNHVAKQEELEHILKNYDIILPKKRNYFIETNYTQYIHAHHKEDLDITKQIIGEKYPEYLNSWDNMMGKTVGHKFNMMIMSKECFNNYCSWLFDILFELEQRLDISNYSEYNQRVFGFVSERLLDIWLDYNKLNYYELHVHETERVHWVRKIYNFLKRKITYELING